MVSDPCWLLGSPTDGGIYMVLVVIIARLTSSRLPRKHFRLIDGESLIWHVIHRAKKIKEDCQIVLATGPIEDNRELGKYVSQLGVDTFYDEDVNDVTGRIARCGEFYSANTIVTLSGDCPLVDPDFIDEGIDLMQRSQAGYIYIEPGYQCLHEGIGFHTLDTWKKADELSTTWFYQEHPGSVIKEQSERFDGIGIIPEKEFRRRDFRMSVDTRADLLFMNEVYARAEKKSGIVDLKSVVKLVDDTKGIRMINAHVHQKRVQEVSRKLAIFTHSSEKIGMGHLSRSIAVATELQESHGAHVMFFVNNQRSVELLEQDGYRAMVIGDKLSDQLLTNVVEKESISCMIVDVRRDHIQSIFEEVREYEGAVVLIDNRPMDNLKNTISIIPAINIGDVREEGVYKGKEYLILKREVSYLRYLNSKNPFDGITLLSGGGAEPDYPLLKLLADRERGLRLKVVVGPFVDREQVVTKLNEYEIDGVDIVQNPPSFIKELKCSRLVIAPFGVTVYEAIALGIPVVIRSVSSESDKDFVRYLSDRHIIVDGLDLNVDDLSGVICDLHADTQLLEQMAAEAFEYIDGLGVEAVANKIVEYYG